MDWLHGRSIDKGPSRQRTSHTATRRISSQLLSNVSWTRSILCGRDKVMFPGAVACARSSTGQSIGLRIRGLGVRIPSGAPIKSNYFCPRTSFYKSIVGARTLSCLSMIWKPLSAAFPSERPFHGVRGKQMISKSADKQLSRLLLCASALYCACSLEQTRGPQKIPSYVNSFQYCPPTAYAADVA